MEEINGEILMANGMGNDQMTQPKIEPPTNLTATRQTNNSILIDWTASISRVTGYRVFRATSLNGMYELVQTTSNTEFTDTNLVSNTTYFYKVEAFMNNETSLGVGPVQATTCTFQNCCCNIRRCEMNFNDFCSCHNMCNNWNNGCCNRNFRCFNNFNNFCNNRFNGFWWF